MLSSFAVAWRTVTKRLLADWLVVAAVFISVLLAAALLAAGPIYADAVTLSALRRTVRDAPAVASGLSAEMALFPQDFDEVDPLAREQLSRAIATTGGDVYGHLEADAYELADSEDSDLTELVSFQSFEGVQERARLVEGRWPESESGITEVAVPNVTAEAMGIGIGDTVDVANRLDKTIAATVEIVGVFAITNPEDAYWLDRELIGSGAIVSGSFRTFGPLVVDREALLANLAPARVTATWRALPDFDQLSVAEVALLREATSRTADRLDLELPDVLGDRSGATSGFTVVTELPTLLAEVDNSLTVTRSSVLALLFQLAILAGYALVLAAGLLSDTRNTETALVRSRGSSPRQMVTTALFESLLIAVPVVITAPFLATWLLELLNQVGPLAAIDLTIDPQVNSGAFVLAGLAASLSVVVLTMTAYRSARAFPGSSPRRGRQTATPVSQRIGLDVALIALAVLAFWQLQEIGPAISSRVRGQFGVDPLLVLAPALGLLAGAVLALRVVPLMARVADWLATRGKGTISALASWQVSRRPSRYARSSLLLIMAIGIGFFAASYATSWTASQRDQASFQIGADIRTIPWQGDQAIEVMHLGSAYQSLAGVTESMPVHTIRGQLGREGQLADFLILDSTAAAGVVDIRGDLSNDWPEVASELSSQRPALGSILLPGEPTTLGLSVEAVETIPEGEDFQPCDFLHEEEEPDFEETCFKAEAMVVLQDGRGLVHRLAMGEVPVNTGVQDLSASLLHSTGSGELIPPEYPLRLVAIELRSRLPEISSREVEMSISSISADGEGVFEQVAVDFDDPSWSTGIHTFGSLSAGPSIAPLPDQAERLVVTIETGAGFVGAGSYFGLRPSGSERIDAIPVAVSSDLVDVLAVGIGDTVRMTPLRLPIDSKIVGTFDAFPTTDPAQRAAVVLDLPTYQAMSYELGVPLPEPEEHWISTTEASAGVVGALRTEPFNSLSVISQQEVIDNLTADPVALATIGALTVGFVAAAVFSVVGFAVTATVSARERLVEFALIRALGMSRRQLGGWLGLEQGALVVVSLALGTVVGIILTAILLPLVILTQTGAIPVPETIVIYPWDTILILELVVVAALAIVVIVMTFLLRRIGLGALLRMGED
ncbi:MAG TPA: ABC transporter permease [Acidimicrobiia bacterium]|nr:ABC transporter permease [Acidimicrobiia bacterium]